MFHLQMWNQMRNIEKTYVLQLCFYANLLSVINHDATKIVSPSLWSPISLASLVSFHKWNIVFVRLKKRRSKFYWKMFKAVVIFGFCAFFSQYPLLISLRSYFQLFRQNYGTYYQIFIVIRLRQSTRTSNFSRFQFPGRRQTYFHYGYYISLHRHP